MALGCSKSTTSRECQRNAAAKGDVAREVLPGLAWQNPAGNVLGLYLHGLLEDPAALQALFGAAVPTLESVFEGMADYVARHFQAGVLDALVAG